MRQLKRDIEVLSAECRREMDKTIREANQYMENSRDKAQIKINEFREKVNEANKKAEHLEDINANLIRIAKERANAQRKIKPKKEHKGYILQNIDETIYVHRRNDDGRTVMTNFPCWRVRFQTPYSLSLDIATVRTLVKDDFRREIGYIIGIETFFKEELFDLSDYKTEVVNAMWEDREEYKNFYFKMVFKLNVSRGFWEVECLTRDMIEISSEILANTD